MASTTDLALPAAPGPRRLRLVPDPVAPDFATGRLWCARPLPQDALLARPRLTRRLVARDAAPLVTVVAPAGFGKTTLLREWEARDRRPFAWVTLDGRHDDRASLLASVADAVCRVAPAGSEAPFVLVVDDVHVLREAAALDGLASIAEALPPAATLALASRAAPPLPIARLRAQRLVTEVGAEELAMTRAEAAALFKAAGHRLDREDGDAVLRQTEGWPMGLALALGMADSSRGSLRRFGGADRTVAQYLRDEVLAGLDAGDLDFMRRTAVADLLTPALCDALVRRPGSSAILGRLERAGILVPLDRTEDRYRYRRLIADLLRAELRRADPALERELHGRAAAWYRRAGVVERAAHHALRAGDVDTAARIAWESVASDLAHGRAAAVEARLRWFTDEQIARRPRLALATALTQLARGDGQLVQHWLALAASPLEDDVEAGATLLGAALARRGLPQMRDDAAWGRSLLLDASPLQSVTFLLEGVAHQLMGEPDAAVSCLEQGVHRAAVPAPGVHALCLSQLALLALDRGDLGRAGELSGRARAQVDRFRLEPDAMAAAVLATSALVRVTRGAIDDGRQDARAATRLRERLTDHPAWYRGELDATLARAALRLGDIGAARTHLAAGLRLLERLPEADTLRRWLLDAREQLDGFAAAEVPLGCALTSAELRILRFMPSHLSFKEIARQANVTPNTVKSHANSLYRKLDVNSRSAAVARAKSCGLVDTG